VSHMKISPWLSALILGIFIGLLSLAFWSGNSWRSIEGVSLSKGDGQGGAFLLVANEIFHFDAEKKLQNHLDLSPFALEHIGDFSFFKNGDVLLVPKTAELNFVENLLVFFRVSGELANKMISKQGRLQRCSFESSQCTPLTQSALSFSRTFSLAIDQQDRIYLADTNQHKIYLLDDKGSELDSISSGLKFPNALNLYGNALYVANTNNHQITKIPFVTVDSERHFSQQEDWQAIKADSDIMLARSDVWPTDLAVSSEGIFMLAQGADLANGHLYHFSHTGDYINDFEIADDVDLISVSNIGENLLVVDYNSQKVSEYNAHGDLLGEIDNETLKSKLNVIKQRQAPYQLFEQVVWIMLGVLVLIGLLVGIFLELRNSSRKKTLEKQQAENLVLGPKPCIDSKEVIWFLPSSKLKRSIVVLHIMMVLSIGMLLIVSLLVVGNIAVLQLIMVFLPFYYFSVYRLKRMMDSRIGFYGAWLLLDDGRGNVAIGSGCDIFYARNKDEIGIGNLLINVGSVYQLVFATEEKERYLNPLLVHARLESPRRLIKLMFNRSSLKDKLAYVFTIVAIIFSQIQF